MGMSINFQVLFEVQIFHSYYRSGESRDFSVEPTAACRKQLVNHGLLFRQLDNGFTVLCESSADKTPVRPIDSDARFAFYLVTKKPYFLNYSKLPLDGMFDMIYRFDNLNKNIRGNDFFLYENGDCISEADRISLKPQLFNYTCNSAEVLSEMRVTDEFGNVVVRKSLVPVDGVVNCPIDLRGCNPGRFTLKVGGKDELKFYTDNDLIRKDAFGIIEIFGGGRVPEGCRFIDAGKITKISYTIRIENRYTRWKYLISLRKRSEPEASSATDSSTTDPSTLSLSCNYDNKNIIFERRGSVSTADGKQQVVTFDSGNELMPLQENVIKGIKLTGTDISIENMPNASAASIKIDPDGKFVSEIFVHI